MKHSIIIRIALVPALLALIGGCGRVLQQPTSETHTPKASIAADCIVNYFQKDGAPYITQQQHRFGPETRYLQIIAAEPSGTYHFTLTNDNYSSSKKLTSFLSGLPASFVNEPLANAVFYSFTAGAGLLNTTQFETQETTKIEGQWYEPIQATENSSKIQVTVLRNRETNQVDLVKLQQSKDETLWLVKSYNYRYSKELDRLVPMKIDIFDIRNGLASKQLIIQIDYKSILTQ